DLFSCSAAAAKRAHVSAPNAKTKPHWSARVDCKVSNSYTGACRTQLTRLTTREQRTISRFLMLVATVVTMTGCSTEREDITLSNEARTLNSYLRAVTCVSLQASDAE